MMSIDPTIKLNLGYGPGAFVQFPKMTDRRIKAESGGRRLDKFIGENIEDLVGLATTMTEDLIFINAITYIPTVTMYVKLNMLNLSMLLKSLKYAVPGLIMMQKDRLKDFWSGLELPNHISTSLYLQLCQEHSKALRLLILQ